MAPVFSLRSRSFTIFGFLALRRKRRRDVFSHARRLFDGDGCIKFGFCSRNVFCTDLSARKNPPPASWRERLHGGKSNAFWRQRSLVRITWFQARRGFCRRFASTKAFRR